MSIGTADDGATEGTDYPAVADLTITIPQGSTSATGSFSIAPVDDTIAEGSETVVVSGSAEGLTGDTAELTITDDDAAPTAISLSLDPDSISEDGGSQTVTVKAALDGSALTVATDVAVSVGGGDDGATEGKDYPEVADFTISIPQGSTSATGTFSIAPVDDTIAEGSETVVVSGSAKGLAGDTAELTITDDDAAPTAISIGLNPDSVTEDGGSQTVTVTASLVGSARTVATDVTVSVGAGDSTATAPADYGAVSNFTISIPQGSTSATGTFSIAPVDDTIAEGSETVVVSGSAEGLTGDTAELTITDKRCRPDRDLFVPGPRQRVRGRRLANGHRDGVAGGGLRGRLRPRWTVSVGGGREHGGSACGLWRGIVVHNQHPGGGNEQGGHVLDRTSRRHHCGGLGDGRGERVCGGSSPAARWSSPLPTTTPSRRRSRCPWPPTA